MEVVDVLKQARELLSDPERWTTKVTARDAFGSPVWAHDERAASFCAIGAVGKVAGGDTEEGHQALMHLRRACGRPISEVNDYHGHDAVLAMFDAAIREQA